MGHSIVSLIQGCLHFRGLDYRVSMYVLGGGGGGGHFTTTY